MCFVATWCCKMTMEGPRNKGQCSSVDPARSKGKLLPTYTQKMVFAQVVIVSALRALLTSSPISSIPSLLHLQPAAASSHLWSTRPSPPSCSMPPLRSSLQLRVPPTPPPCNCRYPLIAPAPPPARTFGIASTQVRSRERLRAFLIDPHTPETEETERLIKINKNAYAIIR
jgi:hypothetical protein